MALSDWRDSIELIVDSDDDVLETSTVPPSRPQQTPVPLPANVRHLFSPPKPRQPSAPVPLPQSVRQLASGSSKLSSNVNTASPTIRTYTQATSAGSSTPTSAKGSASTSRGGQHNGTPQNYVAVFSEAQIQQENNNGFSSKQAGKRRKLSVHGMDKADNLPSRGLAAGIATTSQPNANAGMKLSAMKNGVPTVHSLNSALKAGGATRTTISSDILASEGRALHIGRLPEEQENSFAGAPHDRALGSRPLPMNGALGTSAPDPELDSSDLDELAWDDNQFVTWDQFNPRVSPVKKKRPSVAQLPQDKARHQPQTTFQSGAIALAADDDGDSVISKSSPPRAGGPVVMDWASDVPQAPQAPKSASSNAKAHHAGTKKFTNRFSTEEDHFLIFLKEVKGVKWADIVSHFPTRKLYVLQSRYSHYLNRRDRSKDYTELHRLALPPQYAAEAVVDWATVHNQTVGYAQREPLTYQPAVPTAPSLPAQPVQPVQSIQPTTKPVATVQHIDFQNSAMRKPTLIHQPASYKASPGTETSVRRRRGRPRREERLVDSPIAYESSSKDEPAQRRGPGRPRRNVHLVDYTWPRHHRRSHAADDEEEQEEAYVQESRDITMPWASSEPWEEPSEGPETVIPVDKPMEVDFEEEDADLVVSGHNMPYLSHAQRSTIKEGAISGEWDQCSGRIWQGTAFHVDFSQEEIAIVERTIRKVIGISSEPQRRSHRKQLRDMLKNQSEPKVLHITYEIERRLPSRNRESVNAFLQDARIGKISINPRIERLGAVRPNRKFSSHPKMSTTAVVLQRELGLHSRRGWKSASKTLTYQVKNKVYDSLGPAYSFTGASSDVHTVAWSPDGQCFAAGAVCVTDPDSMQYNRPNNLLYGDVTNKLIHELREHSIDRPRTATGINSTHAMYVSQDPKLFTTVSVVAFSPTQEYMFSAGYDRFACVWRTPTDGSQPKLVKALEHRAEVDLLAVNCHGVWATASKKWKRAVKVITIDSTNDADEPDFYRHSYSSHKADKRPDQNILPTAMQFEPIYGRLLLAGFGANKSQDRLDINGDICLWDVNEEEELLVHASTKNVFDVAWIPHQDERPIFAVGCVAGSNVNRGTRSVVRLYDGRGHEKRTTRVEFECPALDMNDVVFCPYDPNIVAAGCTSGRTYIWDVRQPDSFLYALSHGKSLMPLDEELDREYTDTGIRFLSWGENATRLYTGSSDGSVKVWDVSRSQEDVFIKDLIHVDSGIMSGAFSPDKSRLIVGEVNGSINVLEVGKDDYSIKDMERLRYIPYYDPEPEPTTAKDADSGKAIASHLLEASEMVSVQFGGFPIRQAVQGPNYAGPFDQAVDAPHLREQALQFQLNLAQATGPQCDISSCKESIVKITNEEIGDSGRSGDRIPDELQQQWKFVGNNLTVIPGKSKCTTCGRPARPWDLAADNSTKILCERCSFACFRCGGSCRIDSLTERLVCRTCFRTWDVGALGYECTEETGCSILPSHIPTLDKFEKDINAAKSFKETNVTFGDEMNALTDYYHSLAIDRPESPPL